MAYNSFTSFVRKNPITTAATTIALGAASIFFVIRAPITGLAPTGVQIGQLQTGSGVAVGYFTDLGGMSLSGSVRVADNATGSGTIKVGGSDGGGICLADNDGTGCTCLDGNNGSLIARSGAAAECP